MTDNNIKVSEKDNILYKEYLKIVRSLRSIEDIKLITDIYSSKIKNKDLIKIMDNSIDSHGTNTILGIEEFIDVIESLNKFIYRDDARDYVQKIFRRTSDQTQRSTIIRLIGYKPPKMQKITMRQFNDRLKKKNIINKSCPHCKKITSKSKNTTYVVCGYSENGYDWEGCQKDWCFRCNKKLCKNWFKNDLFNEQNRLHNNICCKQYAYKHNESFNNYYCTCEKIHINHRI